MTVLGTEPAKARWISKIAWMGLVCAALAGPPAFAGPPGADCEPVPAVLTLDAAVGWALQHNPQLATLRQQHGIAAAAVVIARTYPFNPLWQSFTMAATGPPGALDNHVFVEDTVRLDLEVRGQGRHRQQAASAALSRTDWEIATQELNTAVQVIRAFNTVVYRQEKLKQLEETIRLNEQAAEQVSRLAEQGKLRGADRILARSEVQAARALRGPAHALSVTAWNDLRRLLGLVDQPLGVKGVLERPLPAGDEAALAETAAGQRPDIRSRQMALSEAEARYRLEVANRYGNPSLGPAYEYNETRVNFIGLWLVQPLPVLNTRRGEIRQRQAERDRAVMELHQFEIQARQDVHAALARLGEAATWVKSYRTEILPELTRDLEGIEKLFAQNDPGADVLRVINVRRQLLRMNDVYLDALWEASQAQADLAAAVGDPAMAIDGSLSKEGPAATAN